MIYASAPHPGPTGAPGSQPKRPTWHWLLLGGAALVALLIAGIVVLILAWQLLGRSDPESTLDNFYVSLQDSDCELFEESTTPEYRDDTGLTSCQLFEETTSEMTGIDYEVTDRVNRQGYAIFSVTETYTQDGQTVEVPLRYYIERASGQWGLAGIELVEEDAPDPVTGS